MNLFLFARFHARPGCVTAVRQAVHDVQGPTRMEPGCLSYKAFQSVRDRNEFYIHSVWHDRSAFDHHADQPHTLKFVAIIEPLIDNPLSVALTEPLE